MCQGGGVEQPAGGASMGQASTIGLDIGACRKLLALTVGRAWQSTLPFVVGGRPMILSAIAERLKRRSKDDFRGRHFEAPLILQAVCWYLRYPLSYRDIEELFRERGLPVDHATLNRWVLAYGPLIERRLRAFRKPHCGSIRIQSSELSLGAAHSAQVPYPPHAIM